MRLAKPARAATRGAVLVALLVCPGLVAAPQGSPAGGTQAGTGTPSPPEAADAPARVVNLVTLVFDRLDLEGAKLAKDSW